MEEYAEFGMDNRRWAGLEVRPDDIIITTPAKAGTTWLQTICALLIFGPPPFPASLGELSPWLEMNIEPATDVHARLEAQTHRRFIKSHTPLDGLPQREGLRYLCVGRDPRDLALSWIDHDANLDLDGIVQFLTGSLGGERARELYDDRQEYDPDADVAERFTTYVTTDRMMVAGGTLLGVATHLRQAWEARHRSDVLLLHYADLRADLEQEMRRVANFLAIDVEDSAWPTLVEAAGANAMRSRADRLAPGSHRGILRDPSAFFAAGRLQAWRQLPDAAVSAYDERAEQFFEPDLRSWLERPAPVHQPAANAHSI